MIVRPPAPVRLQRTDLQGQAADVVVTSTVSQSQVLRSCLIDLGLVLYPYPDKVGSQTVPLCYVSSIPDATDFAVRLKDTAGRMFGRQARDGKNIIHPGVAILVRALNYAQAWVLANSIAVALDQRLFPFQTQVPEDGSVHRIQNVIRTSEVIDLGEEVGKRRQLVAINARIAFLSDDPTIG